jgi:hypothetical protein
MSSENNASGEDILSEEEVLRILENVKKPRDLAAVEHWLQGRNHLQSCLFDTPMKRSSDSSKATLQSTKASRPKELNFLISLSSLLHIDELTADKLLKEYCQQQILERQTTATLELESFSTLESVRDFFYCQQQYFWRILQELLRIDKDEDHWCYQIAHRSIQALISNNLLSTLLTRTNSLQNWQPITPSKSHFPSFSDSNTPLSPVLLDTQCSEFIGRHMLACTEFTVHELERALETLILLLYTHANLNLSQLESLMELAGRDSFSIPRGCAQLVKAIQGQEQGEGFAFRVPLLITRSGGLPWVEATYKRLGEQICFKYVTLFSETMQFWRAFQPIRENEEKPRHPLLESYNQSNMERFTANLQGKVVSCKDKENVHTVVLLLWGIFLEVFGGSGRAESVFLPRDFFQWVSQFNQSVRGFAGYDDELIDDESVGTKAEVLVKVAVTAGGMEGLVTVLSRVLGLATAINGDINATVSGNPNPHVNHGSCPTLYLILIIMIPLLTQT